jgi:hypothetical protein
LAGTICVPVRPAGWRGMVGRRPSPTTGSDVVRGVGWSSFEFSFENVGLRGADVPASTPRRQLIAEHSGRCTGREMLALGRGLPACRRAGCRCSPHAGPRRADREHLSCWTQSVLPSAETAAMLFWALLASGQINMR